MVVTVAGLVAAGLVAAGLVVALTARKAAKSDKSSWCEFFGVTAPSKRRTESETSTEVLKFILIYISLGT